MADADDTRPRGRSQSFLERAAIEAAAAMKNEYVDSQLVDEWCDDDGTLQAALLLHPGCRGDHATEAVSRARRPASSPSLRLCSLSITALSSCLPAPTHRPHRRAQECWTDNRPDASGVVPHAGVDCSKEVINATLTWLKLGGRRG